MSVRMIQQLQALGLPMTSRYSPREWEDPETHETVTRQLCIAWTTDKAKADAATRVGATVVPFASLSGDARFDGWEVSTYAVLDG